jgi:3-hydroxyacyl-[acyl-carrier-protein] dehydratase
MSDTADAAVAPLDVRRVMAALPHRFPMLLVDRVEEIEVDRRIVATKAVTINEPFFAGHFPGRPIMPGVLIVEALAQAAGVLAVESLGLAGSGKLVYFMAIDAAKFRTPVEPGLSVGPSSGTSAWLRAGRHSPPIRSTPKISAT